MKNNLDIIKKTFIDVNFYTNLYLHSLILFIFLSILFITFISKVSTNAFNKEISELAEKQIHNNISSLNKDPTINNIKKYLSFDKILKYYDKPEIAAKYKNDGIFNTLLMLNGVLCLFFIILVLILKYLTNTELHIKDILIENTCAFLFIGIAEYYFFTKIAMKFIPVEPSFITKEFIEKIKIILK